MVASTHVDARIPAYPNEKETVMSENGHFETRQIHVGHTPDTDTGSRAVPIYQTTSYVFNDTEHAGKRFSLAELGPIYTRLTNPTNGVAEDRIASLEGGGGGLVVASRQAAELVAILNIAEAGDHLVASPSLYGGTYNLLHHNLPKLGLTVTFVDDPHAQGGHPVLRGGGRRGARGRCGADRVQHGRHDLPGPADRARRRRGGALNHQVPRWPRHLDRWGDRGRWHLRLRAGDRAVP